MIVLIRIRLNDYTKFLYNSGCKVIGELLEPACVLQTPAAGAWWEQSLMIRLSSCSFNLGHFTSIIWVQVYGLCMDRRCGH